VKSKKLLSVYLGTMALLIVYALVRPQDFKTVLERPEFYIHAKFVHILFATLLFGNALIGTIWETRGLLTGRIEIVRHTYGTVTWLDAVFTAPVILISVISGIMLGTILGGVWTLGWLAIAFSLFLVTGLVWVAFDIPNQYQVNRLLNASGNESGPLPAELKRLLWRRMAINFLGIAPLLVVFFLMVHKPKLAGLTGWLNRGRVAEAVIAK
jgi:uncharacterized membrane protein